MSAGGTKALLPAGLEDRLPPLAEREATTIGRLIEICDRHGYDRVQPPLIEFEESLLTGPGAPLARQTFRLMDPVSQRMMGVRADITPQIARIAASRLAAAPRPLRLSYGGQVLRVRGDQLRPERQFAQVGAELIGADGTAAEAEIALLAATALSEIGVANLSVDFCAPMLVPDLCAALGIGLEPAAELRAALDSKDAARVQPLAGAHEAVFAALLAASGPVPVVLERVEGLDLPGPARARWTDLARLVATVADAQPELSLTADPVEMQGFEYQTGPAFAIFARGVRGELGRGGRYLLETGESAVGFTLYMDSVMRALPDGARKRAVYLPAGTPWTQGNALRRDGWRTVAGQASAASAAADAARLGCTHILRDGTVEPLAPDG